LREKRREEEINIPNNILRPSCNLWIIVLGHVSAAASAGGVHVGFQSWRLEGYWVGVGDGGADVA